MCADVIGSASPRVADEADQRARKTAIDSLDVFEELGERIQWVRTYVVEDNAYCIYVAPDDSLRRQARKPGMAPSRRAAVRQMMQPARAADAPRRA